MSLNICTDQLLLALAPERRIASVTFMAQEQVPLRHLAAGGAHSGQLRLGGGNPGGQTGPGSGGTFPAAADPAACWPKAA